MRFNRRSLRFTLRPVHFPLYWQWVLIIFKPPLFTFSPFTWCLICTFLYHISHDCGSISHTKPKTMDDPTSLVSLDNSCGAGWLSAHSSYYSPRSRGRRGTVEMADLTEYFRFDWIFSGAVLGYSKIFLIPDIYHRVPPRALRNLLPLHTQWRLLPPAWQPWNTWKPSPTANLPK